MNKKGLQFLWGVLLVLISASIVWAHCEIPCGIYDDHMRIKMISEHIRHH